VLSALPIVSAGNYCCCLWVVSGGLLAAYLLQQNRSAPISAGDGAIVGLLAGIFGATIQFALSIPIGLLVGPMERQIVERLTAMSGRSATIPFAMPGPIGTIVLRVLAFVWTLIVGAVVSSIAGIVGATVFVKPQPRPIPPTP
jgi:hypothetical protein